MTTPIDVQRARFIAEWGARDPLKGEGNRLASLSPEDARIILDALDALVKDNQELRGEKLLIHVKHPHSGETWDYRITPSEIDDTGITIECGAFDEQRYLIKIMKEPK